MAAATGKVSLVVVCGNEACERFEEPVNEIVVPEADAEMFCEAFGQGGEDPS